jgi:hypothetical protein
MGNFVMNIDSEIMIWFKSYGLDGDFVLFVEKLLFKYNKNNKERTGISIVKKA